MNSLRSEPTCSVLEELHVDARRDRFRYLGLLPHLLRGFLQRKAIFEILTPEATRDLYIPVSREQGELLYLTARAIDASTVVEFGTSFGLSTLYLAAAVRDNGGGCVIGSEIEPAKRARAVANLERAGLGDVVDVRLGDALETLSTLPDGIDLVLLDGAKELYIPVLELVEPRLRKGAVIFADNIFTFRKSLRPFVEYVQSGAHGFASTTLHVADGFELSVYVG